MAGRRGKEAPGVDLVAGDAAGEAAAGKDERDEVKFGWRDIVALTIASYEVLLPIVLIFAGALFLIYLVLRLAH